jgi:hypothetical protein
MRTICLGLSAATGGSLAIMSDITQKQDASAVEQLHSALGGVLGVQTYPWVVMLMLIVFSVALSFIFSADSNKKAFYIGASILALMMTAVPYKTLPNLNTSPLPGGAGAATQSWWDRFLIPPQVFAQNTPQPNTTSPFIVHLETEDKKPVSGAIFTLIDPSSNQTIRRSRVQGGDLTFYVNNHPYLLRVQVDGYAIAETPLNPPPRSLTISLAPSSVPLSIQRIFRK